MAEAQLTSLKTQTASFPLMDQPNAWAQGGSNPFTVDKDAEGASPKVKFVGATANGSTTNSWMVRRVTVPNSYASGDFTVTISGLTSPTANTSSTIDVVAYEVGADGEKTGSDLCTTSTQDINSATAADKAFTINGSGLTAGKEIILQIHATTNDNGGTSSAIAAIGKLNISASCYGKVWA